MQYKNEHIEENQTLYEKDTEKEQKEKAFTEYCDAHEEELLNKILEEARRLHLLEE